MLALETAKKFANKTRRAFYTTPLKDEELQLLPRPNPNLALKLSWENPPTGFSVTPCYRQT